MIIVMISWVLKLKDSVEFLKCKYVSQEQIIFSSEKGKFCNRGSSI